MGGDKGELGQTQRKETELLTEDHIQFQVMTLGDYKSQWPMAGPDVSSIVILPTQIALFTDHNTWVRANQNGVLDQAKDQQGQECFFTDPVSPGECALKSSVFGTFI